MAPNRYNKPAKPPICAPTHPKPSKKRSHSILTPSAPAAKKARPRAAPQPTYVSPLLCPEVLLFMPSPLVSTQPLVDVNAEDNNEREDEVKDDNAEELLLLPAVVHFISVWKAFNRKEVLPES